MTEEKLANKILNFELSQSTKEYKQQIELMKNCANLKKFLIF